MNSLSPRQFLFRESEEKSADFFLSLFESRLSNMSLKEGKSKREKEREKEREREGERERYALNVCQTSHLKTSRSVLE